MLKQALLYFMLSVLVVFFAKYTSLLIGYIYFIFMSIGHVLTPLFHALGLQVMGAKVCLLMLIPLIVAGVPAVVYRGIKGERMPYFVELTWGVWLVLLFCIALLR